MCHALPPRPGQASNKAFRFAALFCMFAALCCSLLRMFPSPHPTPAHRFFEPMGCCGQRAPVAHCCSVCKYSSGRCRGGWGLAGQRQRRQRMHAPSTAPIQQHRDAWSIRQGVICTRSIARAALAMLRSVLAASQPQRALPLLNPQWARLPLAPARRGLSGPPAPGGGSGGGRTGPRSLKLFSVPGGWRMARKSEEELEAEALAGAGSQRFPFKVRELPVAPCAGGCSLHCLCLDGLFPTFALPSQDQTWAACRMSLRWRGGWC